MSGIDQSLAAIILDAQLDVTQGTRLLQLEQVVPEMRALETGYLPFTV